MMKVIMMIMMIEIMIAKMSRFKSVGGELGVAASKLISFQPDHLHHHDDHDDDDDDDNDDNYLDVDDHNDVDDDDDNDGDDLG